jgi:hypothetical protein
MRFKKLLNFSKKMMNVMYISIVQHRKGTEMIKLKEEIKKIRNNKLSRIKVIAKQIRKELEDYYDWDADKGCFKNTCHMVTDDLVKKLSDNNIISHRVNGLYHGASDEYEPDMSGWEQEDVWAYNDTIEAGGEFGFNHWWVEADNKWIVDITSDQFHPDEPEEYRVIITDLNDSDYGA